mmetsp:Transcript_129586/g.223912  ORF Transcript_129586/g.223912 Transcript_129586/m.223912 type:complete len:89 (-) Transcript_129586:1588-1854(-)
MVHVPTRPPDCHHNPRLQERSRSPSSLSKLTATRTIPSGIAHVRSAKTQPVCAIACCHSVEKMSVSGHAAPVDVALSRNVSQLSRGLL